MHIIPRSRHLQFQSKDPKLMELSVYHAAKAIKFSSQEELQSTVLPSAKTS